MSTEPDTSTPGTPAVAATPAAAEDDAARDRIKRWRRSAQLVLSDLASKRYANRFSVPVSEKDAPNYRSMVCRPMDLGTVKARLSDGVGVLAPRGGSTGTRVAC